MDHSTHRRNALVRQLRADRLDALLISNPVNVGYLTGFTGDSTYAVLTASKFVLVSDARFEQQLAEECPGVEAHIRPHDRRLPEAVGDVLKKLKAGGVGVEAGHVTLALLEALKSAAGAGVEFTPAGAHVEGLRAVKDAGEVAQIRAAIAVAERAFNMFRATLRGADTEKEMADALEGYVRRAGGERTSFPTIMAVGERGALPHAPPTARPLSSGSKLLIDWGAELRYKSDLTRTVKSPFGEAPSRRNKLERTRYDFDAVYQAVCDAQDAAVAALRDGVAGRDVDAAARKSFAKARVPGHPGLNLAEFFTHGLGHGIGLEVHEAPAVRANSADTLTTGMVITIEPGVYLPGWGGIRVEDDYLITDDGAIRLSTLPRDPGAIG